MPCRHMPLLVHFWHGHAGIQTFACTGMQRYSRTNTRTYERADLRGCGRAAWYNIVEYIVVEYSIV